MTDCIGVLRSKGGSGEYWACSYIALKNKKLGKQTIIIRQNDDPKYEPYTKLGKIEALAEVGPVIKKISVAKNHLISNIKEDWGNFNKPFLEAMLKTNTKHHHIFTTGTSSSVDLQTFKHATTLFNHIYITVDSRVEYSVEHANYLFNNIPTNEREKCSVFCWFTQYLATGIIYDFEIFNYDQWQKFVTDRVPPVR